MYSTLSQILFGIEFKSPYNQHFRSKLSVRQNQNRSDDTNSDTDFESKFEFDQTFIEFNQKSIQNDMILHFHHHF